MTRDTEFAQKIEILSQHLGVVRHVLETLILKLDHDGIYPASSLLKEVDALCQQSRDNKGSGDRTQLLAQIARKLRDADVWTPPSVQSGGKQRR